MGQTQQTVVVHQPQFMPWAGFWFRVLSADVYVVYAGVDMSRGGHGNRVTINGKWATVPVQFGPSKKYCDLRVPDVRAVQKVGRRVQQEVANKRAPYRDRLDPILRVLLGQSKPGLFLLDLDISLMNACMQAMSVRPPKKTCLDVLARSGTPVANLQSCIDLYAPRASVYLSGAGGRDYLNNDSLSGGIQEIRFQRQVRPCSPDSVVQLIAQEADPVAKIMKTFSWVGAEEM